MSIRDAPKILVIENEPPIRKFLRISLESHGYTVIETNTAAAGIGHAISEPPDAVILDLGLPDQDGLEVITRLREWSKVPVIVVSARGRESDKVSALDAGADDYLTKPFGVGELLARLRTEGRPWPPRSRDRRRGDSSHSHGVPVIACPCQSRGQSCYPPPTSKRSLGTGQRLRKPIPARLHGTTSSKDRAGRRSATLYQNRSRSRLSVDGRIGTIVTSQPVVRAAVLLINNSVTSLPPFWQIPTSKRPRKAQFQFVIQRTGSVRGGDRELPKAFAHDRCVRTQ
jgi:CheY-like chemotaxis protein